MQIDIGFGDTITPPPVETTFPTILNGPQPLLLAYPKETVVAEKFEAMVKLGIANSRMKDFHDLRTLSELSRSMDRFSPRQSCGHLNAERHCPPSKRRTSVYFPSSLRMNRSSASGGAFNIKNRLYIEAVPLKRVVNDIERSSCRS